LHSIKQEVIAFWPLTVNRIRLAGAKGASFGCEARGKWRDASGWSSTSLPLTTFPSVLVDVSMDAVEAVTSIDSLIEARFR